VETLSDARIDREHCDARNWNSPFQKAGISVDTDQPPRILLAEDDESAAQLLSDQFELDGCTVEVTPSGARLLELLEQREYQLLVLDPSLPGVSGLDVLFQLRARGSRLPVLILTGGAGAKDRAESLDAGADDCVSKPFSLDELAARVRALLRRGGQVVDRAAILEHVWGASMGMMTNLVDVYINYLRRKVDFDPRMKLIQTVRGLGYRIVSPEECVAAGPPPHDAATFSRFT
jgi:DNA-binding response OmpR family regulator